MDVSIIIVNFNTKELITNCIQSIYEKTIGIAYEIIVVDNASVDGSQQMISEKYSDVKLIELNENIGFGRANNAAIKIALGKYILFLNSDTLLINNAIKLFFCFMEDLPRSTNIGAIGALLLDSNFQITHSFGNHPQIVKDIISELKFNIVNLIGRNKYLKISSSIKQFLKQKEKNFFADNPFFEVEYITGADLFISNELFKDLGGFDKNFFMYYEESDLQYRMKAKGFRSFIIEEPQIQHFESASFKRENVKLSTAFDINSSDIVDIQGNIIFFTNKKYPLQKDDKVFIINSREICTIVECDFKNLMFKALKRRQQNDKNKYD